MVQAMFFDKNFPLMVFFTVHGSDIVIRGNIDPLVYLPTQTNFVLLEISHHLHVPDWSRMNSSIFRLKSVPMGYVRDEFMKDLAPTCEDSGDPRLILTKWSILKRKIGFFGPDEWILSYKWEMRDRNDLHKPIIQSVILEIKKIQTVTPKLVWQYSWRFHPNPVEDDWVKENWR